MFDVIVRPHFDAPPKPGEDFTCENWSCPSKWACKHHFARSYEYNAMIMHEERRWSLPPFWTFEVLPFRTDCGRFKLDKPRDWLRGFCEPMARHWCCTGCEMPECPRGKKVIAFDRARRSA